MPRTRFIFQRKLPRTTISDPGRSVVPVLKQPLTINRAEPSFLSMKRNDCIASTHCFHIVFSRLHESHENDCKLGHQRKSIICVSRYSYFSCGSRTNPARSKPWGVRILMLWRSRRFCMIIKVSYWTLYELKCKIWM